MSKSSTAKARSALRLVLPSVCVAVLLGGSSLIPASTRDPNGTKHRLAADTHVKAKTASTLSKLPLYFIENKGQANPQVDYYVQGSGTSMYFGPGGVTLALTPPAGRRESASTDLVGPQAAKRWAVRQAFIGGDTSVKPEGRNLTPAIVSYFKGSPDEWKTGIPTHSSVTYRNLWPGIDLTYGGTSGQLKYTFLVHPGADPGDIRLAYQGADSVRLNTAGQLEVSTPVGELKDEGPVAWQEAARERRSVAADFDLEATGVYGFRLGVYDVTKPLVIDPVVVTYAGFIGGPNTDGGLGIAVDSGGSAYLTGVANSGFPATTGAFDTSFNGFSDTFVAKVKADGTGLDYATFMGGSLTDDGNDIAVDPTGAAYVTGVTDSTNFPTTTGSLDTSQNGMTDAWVAKLNGNGTALTYSGYIGGSNEDEGWSIVVDGSGVAYLAGDTLSTQTDPTPFPVTVGPDLTQNGNRDAFVAKVKADGSGLTYAGYIGGANHEDGVGIGIDTAGAAFVAGETRSTETSFPVAGGPGTSFNGTGDAYVAKVKTDGTGLTYAGYIGGSDFDEALGLALDESGFAYVTGLTFSTQSSATPFPLATGPDLTYNGGLRDAFVAKVKADGSGLVYAGYIGGSGSDYGTGIAVDELGAAYVTGTTDSSAATFPEKVGPDLSYNGGTGDAFVARVNSAGTGLSHAGYIGGSGLDRGFSVAVDGAGAAYAAGDTYSTQGTFPEKVGPDLTQNGNADAFVAKILEKNLLKNADFESDANSDTRPDNWTSDARFTKSNAVVLSGDFSGRHQATNNSNYTIQQAVKASAGKTYNIEGYVNIPSTADAFTFKLQVRWRKSSGATISTKTVKTYNASTTDWDLANATLKAPSGTTSALVRMAVSSLNATIYVDKFALI